MCRSGMESAGTTRRRCRCSESQRIKHNASVMMSRSARTATEAARTGNSPGLERSRATFCRHMEVWKQAAGMAIEVFPEVPPVISRISEYAPTALDTMPYEQLEHRSAEALEADDVPAAMVLCAELDRRDAMDPDHIEYEEHRRWKNLTTAQRREIRRYIDPHDPRTHPMARQGLMTVREREKALDADYQTWLQGEILRAEEYTCGNLVNPHGRTKQLHGLTNESLWSNHIMAQAYASDELREYWDSISPRLSREAFRQLRDDEYGQSRANAHNETWWT